MKKLKLQLEALAVESFAPEAVPSPAAGTVRAHEERAEAIVTLPLSNCLYSACATCGIYC